MSSDTGSSVPEESSTDLGEVGSYDEMLAVLESAIQEGRRKIESGRVYDAENERVRQKWIRTTANAIDVWRKVKTDRDLEELREELNEVKAAQGEEM